MSKELGFEQGASISNITDVHLDQYYVYVNGTTNKRFPYKYAYLDDSGEYVSLPQRPSITLNAETTELAAAAVTGTDQHGDDGEVEVENYTATSYIYDYAILFSGPDGVLQRLDLTIVPKVFRRSTPHSGYLCKPDGSKDSIQLSSYLRDYIPRTGACSAHTTRSAPCILSSPAPDFAALHPEEAAWLARRLDKTSPLVKSFVSSHLPGKAPLDDTQARLRIGFSNMGGGKRATVYSLGVTETLHKLGIFDQAAWVSGLSGSAWYVTAHYAAMLNKTEAVSPKMVFDDIKSRINDTIWDDVFEGNEVNDAVTRYSPDTGQALTTKMLSHIYVSSYFIYPTQNHCTYLHRSLPTSDLFGGLYFVHPVSATRTGPRRFSAAPS